MLKILESVLPTTLSRVMLVSLMPFSSIGFFLPDYLPLQEWGVSLLGILLLRISLAVSAALLCTSIALVSILLGYKKVTIELVEMKKKMSVQQMIDFQDQLNSEYKKHGL